MELEIIVRVVVKEANAGMHAQFFELLAKRKNPDSEGYTALACCAYSLGIIGEGDLAEYLDTDRVTARGVAKKWHVETGVQPITLSAAAHGKLETLPCRGCGAGADEPCSGTCGGVGEESDCG